MILVKSSFFFLLSAITAYIFNETVYCSLLVPLFMTSIKHHYHGADQKKYRYGWIIGPLDRTLAHIVALKCIYD